MKNTKFKDACWQIRKKYGKRYLSKKQLAEAFRLYADADENKAKFKELLRESLVKK